MSSNNIANSGLSAERTKIGVLGAGAWGTALALHCARMGHDVMIWALEAEVATQINEEHENKTFLPVRWWLHRQRASPALHGTSGSRFSPPPPALAGLPTPRVSACLQQHKGGGKAWKRLAHGDSYTLCGTHGEVNERTMRCRQSGLPRINTVYGVY
jgi:hypothetical protein